MHIAFLTTEYVTEPFFDGGLANYLHRTAIALTQRGHKIEIFTRALNTETLVHQEVIIHRVKPSDRIQRVLHVMTRNRYGSTIRTIASGWSIRQRLLDCHRTKRFDIVQAASYLSPGLGLTHFRPVPLVIRVSSFEPLLRRTNDPDKAQSANEQHLESLERYTLLHCSAVYAPSMFLATIVGNNINRHVDTIRPPFIPDVTEYDTSVLDRSIGTSPYLLYFGSINRLKGCVVLADALSKVLPIVKELRMVFVGKIGTLTATTSLLDYIYQQAGPHRDRIHYLGRLPHSQLYPLIQRSRGVILPSLVDNLPNTCLESMAHEQVIVGTHATSFEELIENEKSGFLVPPGDAEALANAIAKVWHLNDLQRKQIGKNARDRLEDMNPDKACTALESYFKGLL